MTGKLPFTGPAGMINPTADGKAAMIPPEDVDMLPRTTVDESADKVAPPVRVAILSPFQVTHDRVSYRPGEVAEVPQHIAQRWIRSRWVAVLDDEPRRPSRKP
jgi:hypothetical protein